MLEKIAQDSSEEKKKTTISYLIPKITVEEVFVFKKLFICRREREWKELFNIAAVDTVQKSERCFVG